MNERKKIKFRMSEWDILGIVFTLLGTIFLIIGIPISVLEETVGTIFVLIGLPEFAIGVFCLYHAKKKRDAKNKVFSTGTRIEAKIHRIAYHSLVRVNGRAAHIIECSYRDPVNNIIHVFKSENVFKDITLLKEGDSIFVYVNPVDYNQYYVDIDPPLKERELSTVSYYKSFYKKRCYKMILHHLATPFYDRLNSECRDFIL